MCMRVGVCSWSLKPESPADLVKKVTATGVRSLQLALDPFLTGSWDLTEAKSRFADAGIDVLSAMTQTIGEDYTTLESIQATGGLRPDEHWETNLISAHRAAELCVQLGCGLVSFHAGFMPHTRTDPEYDKLLSRVMQYCEPFFACHTKVALETGQESATTLEQFLTDINTKSIGVNFDPANMILYGMGDPTDSLRQLQSHVLQIHLKDAVPALKPGEWGQEVPIGEGAVDWDRFIAAISDYSINANAMIEREAGCQRESDICKGLQHLQHSFISIGASV
jgi:L-ribulose-5-phosphate 3-epimerase